MIKFVGQRYPKLHVGKKLFGYKRFDSYKDSLLPNQILIPKRSYFPPNNDEPTEPEIDAVGSPIITISQGKNIRYMDYSPGFEDVSLENVKESLIAISYREPGRFSCVTEHKVLNHENNDVVAVSAETAIEEESRSKLMSIAASYGDW
ncbi:hypothetical protein Hanom_Chr17g01528501 [Helianthus anomalus]